MFRNVFNPNEPHNVVIYARMSSEKQNERSPDQQFQNVEDLIKRQEYPWTIVKRYRDDAVSGRYVKSRPGLQQMLSDLRSGRVKADLVLVDTMERLSRADDDGELRRRFNKLGVLILTADTGFADPTTVSGKAMRLVESIRSTEDGRIKAHNVLRGKLDSIRQGNWPGGPAPFGFRLRSILKIVNGRQEIDHSVLEPHPETSWIVVEAFHLADEFGLGTSRLARALNENPLIADHHKPFHPSTIGLMLDATIYFGDFVWGRHATDIVDDRRVLQPLPAEDWLRVPGFCEPLVSREVWERVQAIRESRRRARRSTCTKKGIPGLRGPSIVLKYPLSGLVRCALCGRSMVVSSSSPFETKSGEVIRYSYYACPGYSIGGLCSNSQRIAIDWLLKIVSEIIRQRLFLEE